jgi:hypothetical protein
VDSILPVDEEIRRFRTAIGGQPVSALNSASDSREALVRRIMKRGSQPFGMWTTNATPGRIATAAT